MIRVSGLHKSYGDIVAIDNISFSASEGEICGILGPNGAGKTTLFRILCGLTSHEGQVEYDSHSAKPIGAIIEKPKLFGYLSMKNNLRLFAGLQNIHLSDQELEQHILKVGLPVDRKGPVRHFSMGMKQRLGIAIALLGQPGILVLDEPFSGLDPAGVREIRALIAELVRIEKLTVLISSHLVDELQQQCDRLIVLNKGRKIHDSATATASGSTPQPYRLTVAGRPSRQTIETFELQVSGNEVTAVLNRKDANRLLNMLLNEDVEIIDFNPASAAERFFSDP